LPILQGNIAGQPDRNPRFSLSPSSDHQVKLLNCRLCNYIESTYGYYEPGKHKHFFRQSPGVEDVVQSLVCYGVVPRLPVLYVFVVAENEQAALSRAAMTLRAFTAEGIPTRSQKLCSNSYGFISDNLLSTSFPGRLVHRDSSSNSTLNRVLCLVNKRMNNPEAGILPTRIVDLGNARSSIRIVAGQGHRDHYVAVSHCWDQDHSKHFKTAVENMKKRLKSIDFGDMPKSFQDAAIVTRKLGLRYIWIDSLCIVQGQGGDWMTEGGCNSHSERIYIPCSPLTTRRPRRNSLHTEKDM
jgi:hypothetical protein